MAKFTISTLKATRFTVTFELQVNMRIAVQAIKTKSRVEEISRWEDAFIKFANIEKDPNKKQEIKKCITVLNVAQWNNASLETIYSLCADDEETSIVYFVFVFNTFEDLDGFISVIDKANDN